MKIKKGDHVIVIAGKDRGKEGTIFRTIPKTQKVLIEGVGVVKRHQKARKQGSLGQIIEKPTPIHISNVALKDKKTKKAGRVGYIYEEEGTKQKKVRIIRPSGEKA